MSAAKLPEGERKKVTIRPLVKNIEAITRLASMNKRSVNQEIEAAIEAAVKRSEDQK